MGQKRDEEAEESKRKERPSNAEMTIGRPGLEGDSNDKT